MQFSQTSDLVEVDDHSSKEKQHRSPTQVSVPATNTSILTSEVLLLARGLVNETSLTTIRASFVLTPCATRRISHQITPNERPSSPYILSKGTYIPYLEDGDDAGGRRGSSFCQIRTSKETRTHHDTGVQRSGIQGKTLDRPPQSHGNHKLLIVPFINKEKSSYLTSVSKAVVVRG